MFDIRETRQSDARHEKIVIRACGPPRSSRGHFSFAMKSVNAVDAPSLIASRLEDRRT